MRSAVRRRLPGRPGRELDPDGPAHRKVGAPTFGPRADGVPLPSDGADVPAASGPDSGGKKKRQSGKEKVAAGAGSGSATVGRLLDRKRASTTRPGGDDDKPG